MPNLTPHQVQKETKVPVNHGNRAEVTIEITVRIEIHVIAVIVVIIVIIVTVVIEIDVTVDMTNAIILAIIEIADRHVCQKADFNGGLV